MTALPACECRGKETRSEVYECLSVKVLAPNGVTADYCRKCEAKKCRIKGKKREWKPEMPGPGTELAKILKSLGFKSCWTCADFAKRMNVWGVDGCRQRRPEIVTRLKEKAREVGWSKWCAAFRLLKEPWFRVLDPFGSIIDEAIRRTEEQADEKV